MIVHDRLRLVNSCKVKLVQDRHVVILELFRPGCAMLSHDKTGYVM
jgi:hypothetical protein